MPEGSNDQPSSIEGATEKGTERDSADSGQQTLQFAPAEPLAPLDEEMASQAAADPKATAFFKDHVPSFMQLNDGDLQFLSSLACHQSYTAGERA